MFATVLVIHIIACILLVLVVLLQSGRGAELGAAFGSVGQAQFGRGRATFLSKFTTGLAVIFMVTSLSLAFMSSEAPRESLLQPDGTEPVTIPGAATQPQLPVEQSSQEGAAPGALSEASNPPAQPGTLQPTDAPPEEKRE